MHTRYYLQALGITGLFILMLFILWVASGGPASEAQVQNAYSTRTAIAMTEIFLMKPWPTDTPQSFLTPTSVPRTNGAPTNIPSTNSAPSDIVSTRIPSTNSARPGGSGSTSGRQPLLPSTNTPFATPLPSQSAIVGTPGIPQTGAQSPAEFARWYFGRVWNERDYQNLWDNYLTASFKTHVGSGLFEDYTHWWDSVERVEVNAVDVLENNGTHAWIRVNITIHMKNGHVLPNQIFDYDLLYDATRATWMFDYGT